MQELKRSGCATVDLFARMAVALSDDGVSVFVHAHTLRRLASRVRRSAHTSQSRGPSPSGGLRGVHSAPSAGLDAPALLAQSSPGCAGTLTGMEAIGAYPSVCAPFSSSRVKACVCLRLPKAFGPPSGQRKAASPQRDLIMACHLPTIAWRRVGCQLWALGIGSGTWRFGSAVVESSLDPPRRRDHEVSQSS